MEAVGAINKKGRIILKLSLKSTKYGVSGKQQKYFTLRLGTTYFVFLNHVIAFGTTQPAGTV
jgi:hypothetical protein